MLYADEGWWEAGYGCMMDYSELGSGVLRQIELTYDPRSTGDPKHTEFLAHTYVFSHDETSDENTTRERMDVLLAPELMTAEEMRRMTDTASAVLSQEKSGAYRTTTHILIDTLAHLRNAGLVDPSEALQCMQRLCEATESVEYDEVIGQFMQEVNSAAWVRQVYPGEADGSVAR